MFWRCIEVVITRLTRNQLTGQTVRGFESLHLRQVSACKAGALIYYKDEGSNPRGRKAPGELSARRRAKARRSGLLRSKRESLHLRQVSACKAGALIYYKNGWLKPQKKTRSSLLKSEDLVLHRNMIIYWRECSSSISPLHLHRRSHDTVMLQWYDRKPSGS